MTINAMNAINNYLATAIALALTAQLAGCDINNDENLLKSRAAMAIAEAETKQQGRPRSKQDAKPQPRNQTEHNERNRRILYFGATYCPACRLAEESLERLSQAGWQVGPEPTNHIQTFSIDSPNPAARNRARELNVHKVPTWILWQDGRERDRIAGVLDPFEIGKLFKKDEKRSATRKTRSRTPAIAQAPAPQTRATFVPARRQSKLGKVTGDQYHPHQEHDKSEDNDPNHYSSSSSLKRFMASRLIQKIIMVSTTTPTAAKTVIISDAAW